MAKPIEDSSGLSTAAIAGIVIGAIAGLTALCLIAIFSLRARRDKKLSQNTYFAAHTADYPADHKNASELDVEHANLSEVYGSQIFEMQDGQGSKAELGAGLQAPKHELAAGVQVSELCGKTGAKMELGDTSRNASKVELADTSSQYAGSDKRERKVYEMP